MSDTPLNELDTTIIGELLRLKARCAALESVLEAVAMKAGLDGLKVRTFLVDVKEAVHQKLLEQAETLDPGLAAQIDTRKDFPDILDALL
jgi:hypothetical protein